ncbi:MAG: CDP-alcohol phosphatidyltransferase family protein [Gemmatimonadota bacterium]|nr:MAG: CDP-alcohol phosphatidyltransferase family protein [Gemmatimonadota bacterium]
METVRKAVEQRLVAILNPIINWMVRKRVHPNALSTIGFLVTMSSAFAFGYNHIRTAGVLILLGGLFDLFDGRVARATGLASEFGAFYDSTLDRISEIAVYIGLLSLYNTYHPQLGDVGTIYAIMLAMAGSLMISYTRARAQGLGIDCKVGLMQRGERVVMIGLAALLFGGESSGLALRVVIIAVAILTNLTAIHRIIWVYQHTRGSRRKPVAAQSAVAEGSDPEPTVGDNKGTA